MCRNWIRKISTVKNYIDSHICEISNISEISEKFDMHINELSSWFNIAYKTTPKEYILNRKIEELKNILRREGDGQVIFYYAYRLGFNTESALCHLIKRRTDLTFTEFKQEVLNE